LPFADTAAASDFGLCGEYRTVADKIGVFSPKGVDNHDDGNQKLSPLW
jgi:hypothetical protein